MVRLWVRLTFGSDVLPSAEILWPSVILLQVRLTFGQTLGEVELWSDVPPRMRLQVRLTFGQTLGQVDLWFRCTATSRHLVARCDTTSGQV